MEQMAMVKAKSKGGQTPTIYSGALIAKEEPRPNLNPHYWRGAKDGRVII